jgi:hypothetical protein
MRFDRGLPLFLCLFLGLALGQTAAHATLFEENAGQMSYPRAEAEQVNDQQELTDLITTLQTLPDELATRLEYASRYFLGRPYLLGGPLGEGANAEYDQDPLFRADGFDCTTYVETVNALARAHDFNDFLSILLHIRYQDGNVSFKTRNHFVELDWNPNNIAAGFFLDFTRGVGASSDQSIAVQAFSKKTWYQDLPASTLHIDGAGPDLLAERLEQLHHEGDAFPDVTSQLPYLLKASLLSNGVQSTLPTPAILNIVRDEPFPTATSPKARMVTHQMLLLTINGALHIRQASSLQMKVIDSLYSDYVQTLLASPSTQGINVLKILPRP